jgi:hypothetical protein
VPKLLHILKGMAVAGPLGGLLFAAVILIPMGALSYLGEFLFFATLFVLGALGVLFVPGWFALNALGWRNWTVAPVWGALSMLLAPVLVQITIDGEFRSYTPINADIEVLAPAVIGAMVGSVVWWIARAELAKNA